MMIGGDMTSVTHPAIYSGDYTGDSETIITITFDVPESGQLCKTDSKDITTCDVAIWFGAHVAFSGDWGDDTGASSINGSPYHVALFRVDDASVGKRDNQMQSDTIPMNNDLTVTKTAVPHFTRTFAWDITKVADETEVKIAEGGSYTFNYTVGVTHDAGTDSDWVVDGVITVTNPNGVDIPLDTVLDEVDNAREAFGQQDDACCAFCDVRGATHRDPNFRLAQGRRVIHSVPGHRDDVTVGLQALDDGEFVFRKYLG